MKIRLQKTKKEHKALLKVVAPEMPFNSFCECRTEFFNSRNHSALARTKYFRAGV